MEFIINLVKQCFTFNSKTEISFNSKDKHQNKMVNNLFALTDIIETNKS